MLCTVYTAHRTTNDTILKNVHYNIRFHIYDVIVICELFIRSRLISTVIAKKIINQVKVKPLSTAVLGTPSALANRKGKLGPMIRRARAACVT